MNRTPIRALLATLTALLSCIAMLCGTAAHGWGGHDEHHSSRVAEIPKATPTTPTVVNYAFNPNVIAATATGQIRLSTRVTGPAPTVTNLVSEWGITYALTDAGGADDAVAGDGIYSVNLPVQQILSRRVASDIARVFVGYLDVYSGSTRTMRVNVFAQVRSADIPTVAVKSLTSSAQLSTHLLNISVPTLFRTPDVDTPSISAIAQAAYAHLTDDFDFLNIVFDRQQIENRSHFETVSNVTGIGRSPSNSNAQYGNPNKLRGISVFPSGAFFDGASIAHSHELGHQWSAFLANAELAVGIPHWPSSTMAADIMGLSIPGTGAGGSFSCKLTPEGTGLRVQPISSSIAAVFNPLDLYVMGLLPAAEVPDQWVITDANFSANWSTLCDGRLLNSGFKRLTIAEVIAANGVRSPDYTASQRTFRVATVVVSDGLLSGEGMSLYNYFAQRMEARTRLDMHDGFLKSPGAPFFVATGGRGALIATVDPLVAINTKVTVVEYLNAQLNYYFLTSRDNEKALLDSAAGWARTGATFTVFANPEPNTSGNVRFYFDQIARAGGPNGIVRGSHFYTLNPADIAALQAVNPSNAATPKLPVNEGVDSFAFRPNGSGVSATCPSATLPVYRLFRGSARFPDDPNHRFTTSRSVYDQFLAAGWDGEGVNFCVPTN